jgi:Ca2+-binding RTX toxin-like protein
MDLNDVDHIHFNALGGADNIVVNDLSGTDVTQVDIDLAATLGGGMGDGAQDRITVMGTAANDTIAVTDSYSSIIVSGLHAQISIEHAEAASDVLVVSAGAGDDTIDASGLGASIGLQLFGGDGADTLLSGAGDDLVTGGRGDDSAKMGAGDDTFVWNPGDGNDTVEGQAGTDTMQFNGANISENIDISANGDHVRFTRDVANITMDLKGVERVDFTALGGADNVHVHDLYGTDAQQVNVDLGVAGGGSDGQPDRVTLDGTAGNDSLAVTQSGSAVIVSGLTAQLSVDHGDATQDSLAIAAGAGNDLIDASAMPAAASLALDLDGGDGNDDVRGGGGQDTFIGGAGNDVFVHGNFTILDFQSGADKVDLKGVAGATDFAAVMAHAQDAGGNVTLDFGAGEHMTIAGVSSADLHANDFLLS